MKKFFVTLLSVLIGAAAIVLLFLSQSGEDGPKYVAKGNTEHKPISLKPFEYKCSECDMDIEDMHYAAQIVTKEGITYFFDDIGCVVLWLKVHPTDNYFVMTRTKDTGRWIKAEHAWYSRIDQTPMGYGFGAYENRSDELLDYERMSELMLQGRHLHDPFIKKSLLEAGGN